MRHIFMIAMALWSLLANTGCKTTQPQVSDNKSIALLPISLVIAETVLDNLVAYTLEMQWEKVFEKLLASQKNIGDVNDTEFDLNAKKLSSDLTLEFQRPLRIKLNSLQDTLSRDYVSGGPDSPELLALMVDKANDIRSTLEEFAKPGASAESISGALASYQSYLLISSLSLAIMRERIRAAELAPARNEDVIGKLKGNLILAAKSDAAFIKSLYGSYFESYAKSKLLRYSIKSKPSKIDFGFESGVRYVACVSDSEGKEKCAPSSPTSCESELNSACVMKAQNEAKAELIKTAYEKTMMETARKKFFAIDLNQFADKLENKARLK